MNHISGTEPSSLILSQTKVFNNLKSTASKVPKQAEAKREDVIHAQNYNFNQFLTRKILILSNATMYESTRVDHRTWLHVPSGNRRSTSSDTDQVVEI